MYVVHSEEEAEAKKAELKEDEDKIKKSIKLVKEGVCVAASTLGSLEALLSFLKSSKIPVSYICIGEVSKNDVLKALKAILKEDVSARK